MNPTVFIVALLAFLAVVLLLPAWLRYRTQAAKLDLIGRALDTGQPLDPTLLDVKPTRGDPVLGKWYAALSFVVACLSLGTALALLFGGAFLGMGSEEGAGPRMLIGGMVSSFVGISHLALGLISLRLFTGRQGPALRSSFANVLALVCIFLGVAAFSSGLGMAAAIPMVGWLPYPEVESRAGAIVGAVMNVGPGIGLVVLGVVVLRIFTEPRET